MKIISLDTIDSTNTYLAKDVDTFENFTFVSASFQTSGKGREDRVWNASKGENLLFSFLLKDPLLIKEYKRVSMLTAVVVVKALEKEGLNDVKIKWPNDVYVGEKKICGILLSGCLPNYLIVGVGINLNQRKFEGNYRTTPTSYFLEKCEQIDISKFKINLFNDIVSEFESLKTNKNNFIDFVKDRDFLKGKTRKILLENKEEIVEVISINDDCSLSVKKDDKIITLESGEIN